MCERGCSSNLWQEETLAGLQPSACFPHNQTFAPVKTLHRNLELWVLIRVLNEIIKHLHSTMGQLTQNIYKTNWISIVTI